MFEAGTHYKELALPIPNLCLAYCFRYLLIISGGVAQLGEHLPCKQGVRSSNLLISTITQSQRLSRLRSELGRRRQSEARHKAIEGSLKTAQAKKERVLGQARKGVWWMPRRQEAKKDAASCDKPRGAASEHRSVDVRMGEPTWWETRYPGLNKIGSAGRDPVN